MEGLSKKEKGLMGMDNSVVIMGEGSIRELNGNGKNTIKLFFKKRDLPVEPVWYNPFLDKLPPSPKFSRAV